MKKLLLAAFCFVMATSSFASVASDFKANIGAGGEDGIKNYAGDMGLVTGVNDFHDGQAVSFPGFDIGLAGNFLKPANEIDKSADNSYVFMPFVYANAKLPFLGLNLYARGTSYDGFASIGGGLKYSVLGSSILPFFPDITAGVYYDRLTTDYYSADHMSASVSASLKIFIIEPYAGIGYDSTDLSVKSTGTVFDGNSYKGEGARATFGLNITPIPFTYVYGSYTVAENSKVAQAGLGVRF